MAAEAIAQGLTRASEKIENICLPIADGGDGSLTVMARHLGAKIYSVRARGPMDDPVVAQYGWNASDRLAVVELAEASGLRLVDQPDPWNATTHGTGEVINNVFLQGASRVYLTVGGSATVDGGIGILEALGCEFRDQHGEPMERLKPSDIQRIGAIDTRGLEDFKQQCQLTVLCDVYNPLVGEKGAARVFGPQKGLAEQDIPWFDDALQHLANLIENACQIRVHELAHGGASGGVAAVLHGVLNADLVAGADQILQWMDFEGHLKNAEVLITGEGRIDGQTNLGKGPGLVARLGKEHGLKVIGLSGGVEEELTPVTYFDAIFPIVNQPMDLSEAMKSTYSNLQRTAFQLGKLLTAD